MPVCRENKSRKYQLLSVKKIGSWSGSELLGPVDTSEARKKGVKMVKHEMFVTFHDKAAIFLQQMKTVTKEARKCLQTAGVRLNVNNGDFSPSVI